MFGHHHAGRTTWLWWLTLIAVVVGGAIMFVLSQNRVDRSADTAMIMGLGATVIVAGVCIICATSNWWIKR